MHSTFVPGKRGAREHDADDVGARQLAMPGAVACTRRAGSAVLFDERTLHAAMPNVGGADRCSLTVRYAPFWMKQAGSIVKHAETLAARGELDTPLKRQLLGRRRDDGTVSEMDWADPEYATTHFRPDLR